jgi:hypothetical protein
MRARSISRPDGLQLRVGWPAGGEQRDGQDVPPDGNGAVVEIFNGTLKDELTNLATGRSIVVNVSGPAKVINYPDGSATASYEGHSLLFFFATDIPAGPAAYLFSGRVVANYTGSGQQTIVRASGTREDICAALS